MTTDEKNPILSAFDIPWDEGLDTFYNEERTGLIVACVSAEYQGKRLGTYINENGVPEMGEAMSLPSPTSPCSPRPPLSSWTSRRRPVPDRWRRERQGYHPQLDGG